MIFDITLNAALFYFIKLGQLCYFEVLPQYLSTYLIFIFVCVSYFLLELAVQSPWNHKAFTFLWPWHKATFITNNFLKMQFSKLGNLEDKYKFYLTFLYYRLKHQKCSIFIYQLRKMNQVIHQRYHLKGCYIIRLLSSRFSIISDLLNVGQRKDDRPLLSSKTWFVGS